jgi:uncharacterized membrane protein
MGKSRRTRIRSPNAAMAQAPRVDWIVAALAGTGVLLAGYLWWAQTGSAALPGCPVGGGCDLIQHSRWSRLFEVPIAVWGALFYGAIFGVAILPALAPRRRALEFVLAGIGCFASAYLTLMTRRELGATCPYCLLSFGLVVALLAVAVIRAAWAERAWLGLLTGLLGLLVVGIMHRQFGGFENAMNGPVDPHLRALAEHLANHGAKFFGAEWCPHCREQKVMFGGAAKWLPYVECSPNGPQAPQATTCLAHNITRYPTWIIDGHTYEKLLSAQQLAALSGYQPTVREAP